MGWACRLRGGAAALWLFGQACALSQVTTAARPAAAAAASAARPPQRGQQVEHRVARHQTLWSIARRYRVEVAALRRANNLPADATLQVGQRLRVPRPGPPSATVAAGRKQVARPAGWAGRLGGGRGALQWPVRGRLTSHFGARDGRAHDGIDIGAPAGTRVAAAADGEVVFANEHRGYGKVVILRHANGLMTVYAHHRRNHVRLGQKVRRGQQIAEVGSTGRSSGPHLHFEVRHRAQPADPLRFLPGTRPS